MGAQILNYWDLFEILFNIMDLAISPLGKCSLFLTNLLYYIFFSNGVEVLIPRSSYCLKKIKFFFGKIRFWYLKFFVAIFLFTGFIIYGTHMIYREFNLRLTKDISPINCPITVKFIHVSFEDLAELKRICIQLQWLYKNYENFSAVGYS